MSCFPANCTASLRGDRIACRLADSAGDAGVFVSAPESSAAVVLEASAFAPDSYSASVAAFSLFALELCSAAALEIPVSGQR